MAEFDLETWANDRRVKATLVLAGSMSIIPAAIVSLALPKIRTAFADAPNAALLTGLVLTLPTLFIAVGASVAGALIDRVGRLRILAAAAVLYALARSAPLIVDSLATLLATRAVLGIAVASLFVTGTALITDYYTGQTRSAMLGIQSALATASGVVFLPAAGLLAGLGWRGPFVLYFVSLALLPSVVLLLREPLQTSGEDTTAGGTEATTLPRRSLTAVYTLAFIGMVAF